MWLLLTLCFQAPDRIPLPEQVLGIADAVGKGNYWYILDHIEIAVWKIDQSGNLVSAARSRGPGPGEFARPQSLNLIGDELWVCDFAKREALVFDLDLNFRRSYRVTDHCREIAHLESEFYLVMHHPGSNTIVQRMDRNMNRIGGFGSSLSADPTVDKRMIYGMESGTIAIHKGFVFFAHNFRPVLEVFSPEGSAIRRVVLPGFEDRPFIEDDGSRYNLMKLYATGDLILIDLRDHQERRSFGFVYNPASRHFSKLNYVPRLYEGGGEDRGVILYSPFYKDDLPSSLLKVTVEDILTNRYWGRKPGASLTAASNTNADKTSTARPFTNRVPVSVAGNQRDQP